MCYSIILLADNSGGKKPNKLHKYPQKNVVANTGANFVGMYIMFYLILNSIKLIKNVKATFRCCPLIRNAF